MILCVFQLFSLPPHIMLRSIAFLIVYCVFPFAFLNQSLIEEPFCYIPMPNPNLVNSASGSIVHTSTGMLSSTQAESDEDNALILFKTYYSGHAVLTT